MTDEQNSSARRRRVPYFERPRPPRDWRFWVGGLGRSMIILGLLVFAFVVILAMFLLEKRIGRLKQ